MNYRGWPRSDGVRTALFVASRKGEKRHMLDRVRAFAEKYQMICPGDKVVAGVSGGADSVCLLLLLKELCREKGAKLFAVHVNHCLRGAEADGDEAYVRELCDKLQVPLRVYSFDVKERAGREHLTLEEAGRVCRYEAFAQEAKRLDGARIAVAHHAGDQAETVLFRLFRGSGLRGLCGMSPVRDAIIRPLLFAERGEIEDWLKEQGIHWRTDSTNLSPDYTRNRIRSEILTTAREAVNAKAIRHVAEAAAELREVEDYLEQRTDAAYRLAVREEEDARFVFANAFAGEDPLIGGRLLRRCMAELGGLKDVERLHIEQLRELMDKQTGSRIDLPDGRSARREYEGIRICGSGKSASQAQNAEASSAPIYPPIPGSIEIRGQRWEFALKTAVENEIIPKKRYTKWFDYDRIKKCPEIRGRRPGDYLEIDEAHRRKKLKAYLIDEKIPAGKRNELLLLADESHVLWIPGYRISEAYKVTENTRTILQVEISGGNEHG